MSRLLSPAIEDWSFRGDATIHADYVITDTTCTTTTTTTTTRPSTTTDFIQLMKTVSRMQPRGYGVEGRRYGRSAKKILEFSLNVVLGDRYTNTHSYLIVSMTVAVLGYR